MKKRTVTVVVPAHNEEKYVARCIRSIRAAAEVYGGEVEIIVVCNRCTDRTAEIAEKLCISSNSVHSHVAHLLAKTGYTSRTRLAVDARVLGLVINPRGNASDS